jgi:hypothetical protein
MIESITKPEEKKQSWTVGELLDTEFPNIQWVIPNLLPSGLTILGGRPKVGKSWFMLQAACAVGTGGKFFDKDIEKGSVLYIAYEDGPRRLKERIEKLGIHRNADIRFVREWMPLQNGGVDDLAIEIARKYYRLIVIDTLTRSIPGVDQDTAQIIGPITATLQTMATDRNMGMVLIDHLKKPSGYNSDPVDDIMSSTAKTANADAILAIYKERGKKGAFLRGRGRDIDEIDLRIFWDKNTSCWLPMGDSGEIEISERQEEILSFLSQNGKSQSSYISKSIRQDYGNTYRRLQDMVTAGMIQSSLIEGKTYYAKN